MNDTLSINIRIDSRNYPLVVNRKDEERYRNAAKKLNDIIQAFRKDYPDKESQDIMAMAAFQVVYSSLLDEEKADQLPLMNELKDLRDDLADFLNEKSER